MYQVRQCRFNQEFPLGGNKSIFRDYTKKSCMFECRLQVALTKAE